MSIFPLGKKYLYVRCRQLNLALKSRPTGAHDSTRMSSGSVLLSIIMYGNSSVLSPVKEGMQ